MVNIAYLSAFFCFFNNHYSNVCHFSQARVTQRLWLHWFIFQITALLFLKLENLIFVFNGIILFFSF